MDLFCTIDESKLEPHITLNELEYFFFHYFIAKIYYLRSFRFRRLLQRAQKTYS